VPREALGFQHAELNTRASSTRPMQVAMPMRRASIRPRKRHDFFDPSQLAVIAALDFRCRARDLAGSLSSPHTARFALSISNARLLRFKPEVRRLLVAAVAVEREAVSARVRTLSCDGFVRASSFRLWSCSGVSECHLLDEPPTKGRIVGQLDAGAPARPRPAVRDVCRRC